MGKIADFRSFLNQEETKGTHSYFCSANAKVCCRSWCNAHVRAQALQCSVSLREDSLREHETEDCAMSLERLTDSELFRAFAE